MFLGAFGVRYVDVVSVCRLLRDTRPQIGRMVLWERFNYGQAEDISWMVGERPYKRWRKVEVPGVHRWENDDGDVRVSEIVEAPQSIPE